MAERILLKTTIPTTEDDWHIGRFSRLAAHLASLKADAGAPLYAVTAADRTQTEAGDDADLEALAAGAYDQLWLFAVDVTGALTARDAANIEAFRKRGGGVLLTRDHQDLGACLTKLGALGATQYFQSVNPDPDPARHRRDDELTQAISWPNYHSGANGDLQAIECPGPHPLVADAAGGVIRHLPAHPHEGAVGAPVSLGAAAQVVAFGRSQVTGARFNICLAVEEPGRGRGVSDSSFHHFSDYNWNPTMGCPSFVEESAGRQVLERPHALAGAHRYVENIAAWLSAARRP
jgi:hypothetical protein